MRILLGCVATGLLTTGLAHAQLAPAPPNWAVGAVFYQIFPERFHNGDRSNDPTRDSLEEPSRVSRDWRVSPWDTTWNSVQPWESGDFGRIASDRRYGGDLQGIIDKLPYLKDLGIDVIYLNPIFQARSAHKYDGASFHHVDPHFGPDPTGDFAATSDETEKPKTWVWTEADRLFLKLLRESHAIGIRVVIDGVFNHTGRDFFAFADLIKRGPASPYRDWYTIEAFDNPATPADELRYRSWWGFRSLPELADTPDRSDLAPSPKRYVLDATRRWMDPNGDGDPSDGVDGWRLDVAGDVPSGFWRDWHAEARRLNPNVYTVAEEWNAPGPLLESAGFSAAMNYHGFAYPVKGFFLDGKIAASDLLKRITQPTLSQERRNVMQNLIDSHDTPRLATMAIHPAPAGEYRWPERCDFDVASHSTSTDDRTLDPRQRSLCELVALFQMTCPGAPMIYYGDEAGMRGADDPHNRQPLAWPVFVGSNASDPALHTFYREACHLRRECPALRNGPMKVIAIDDAQRAFAFQRGEGLAAVVTVMNLGDRHWRCELDPGPGDSWQVVLRSGDADLEERVVSVGPRCAAVIGRSPGSDLGGE